MAARMKLQSPLAGSSGAMRPEVSLAPERAATPLARWRTHQRLARAGSGRGLLRPSLADIGREGDGNPSAGAERYALEGPEQPPQAEVTVAAASVLEEEERVERARRERREEAGSAAAAAAAAPKGPTEAEVRAEMRALAKNKARMHGTLAAVLSPSNDVDGGGGGGGRSSKGDASTSRGRRRGAAAPVTRHNRRLVKQFPDLFEAAGSDKATPIMGEFGRKYSKTLVVKAALPGRVSIPASIGATVGSSSESGTPRQARYDAPGLGYGLRYVQPVPNRRLYQATKMVEPPTPRSDVSGFSLRSARSDASMTTLDDELMKYRQVLSRSPQYQSYHLQRLRDFEADDPEVASPAPVRSVHLRRPPLISRSSSRDLLTGTASQSMRNLLRSRDEPREGRVSTVSRGSRSGRASSGRAPSPDGLNSGRGQQSGRAASPLAVGSGGGGIRPAGLNVITSGSPMGTDMRRAGLTPGGTAFADPADNLVHLHQLPESSPKTPVKRERLASVASDSFLFAASPFSRAAQESFLDVYGARGITGLGKKAGTMPMTSLTDGIAGSSGSGESKPLVDVNDPYSPEEHLWRNQIAAALQEVLKPLTENVPGNPVRHIRPHLSRGFAFVEFYSEMEAEITKVLIDRAIAQAESRGRRHNIFRAAHYI